MKKTSKIVSSHRSSHIPVKSSQVIFT